MGHTLKNKFIESVQIYFIIIIIGHGSDSIAVFYFEIPDERCRKQDGLWVAVCKSAPFSP